MGHIQVKTERLVNASPESIYAVLSDYISKRPQLLTPNFMNYQVEKGGQGTGTVVSYRLHAANRERDYRLRVDEPVKGRVITERDANSSLVNTWTLSPINDGAGTRVSVISEWEGGSGVKGFFERTFAPLGLKSIYGKILSMLSLLVTGMDSRDAFQAQDGGSFLSKRVGLIVALVVSAVGTALLLNYLRQKRQ